MILNVVTPFGRNCVNINKNYDCQKIYDFILSTLTNHNLNGVEVIEDDICEIRLFNKRNQYSKSDDFMFLLFYGYDDYIFMKQSEIKSVLDYNWDRILAFIESHFDISNLDINVNIYNYQYCDIINLKDSKSDDEIKELILNTLITNRNYNYNDQYPTIYTSTDLIYIKPNLDIRIFYNEAELITNKSIISEYLNIIWTKVKEKLLYYNKCHK